MAAPHGSTSSTGNNPTSGTFTLPGAAATGDLALFYLYARAGLYDIAAITGITTHHTTDNGPNGRCWIGYRYVQGGDTTFGFTRSSGSSNADVVWGVDVFPAADVFASGNPFEASTGATPTTGTSVDPDPGAVTPLTSGAIMWLVSGKRDDSATQTVPSGYTLGWADTSTVGADAWAGTAFKYGVPASSQDPGAWDIAGGSFEWLAWTAALKPSSGAAGVITPGPVDMVLAVPSRWTVEVGTGLLPDAVPLPIVLYVPEAVAAGSSTIVLTPLPVVLGPDFEDALIQHAVQPEVWAPEQTFSGRLYASATSLWSGIQRALPIWDTATVGRSYANDGTITAYTGSDETGDDDLGAPESWYAVLDGAVSAAKMFDLGSYDPGTTGSVFLRIKPRAILGTGVLAGFTDGFEFRHDDLGYIYNDAFRSGASNPSSTGIAVNRWQSLLFTWNSTTGENTAAIDGVDVLNQTAATADPGSGTLKIGGRDGSTNYVSMLVSAIYVWDRVLNPTERAVVSNDPWAMFRQQAGVLTPAVVPLPLDIPAAAMVLAKDLAPTPIMLPLSAVTPSVTVSTIGKSSATIPKPLGHKALMTTRTG
jgi:hypothetical protein